MDDFFQQFEPLRFRISDKAFIDFDKTLEDQKDILREDMLQISFENGYLIDLGWYERGKKEFFLLLVIKNKNWEAPLKTIEINGLRELREALAKLIVETEAL